MAVQVDDSSPVATTTSTATNTSNAFVPPESALLLALWAGNSLGGTGPTVGPAFSSSPSQTWTRDNWDQRDTGSPVEDGQSALGHATPSGSPGSTTVQVVNGTTANYDSILKVLVITSHDPIAPIGVTGGGRQDSGSSITVTFTASITGGQGFLVISDWWANSMASVSAATGCTILDRGTVAGQVSYLTVQRTDPDEVAGVSTSLGVTGLTTAGRYHWSYVEVISAEAAEAARVDEWTFGQALTIG